MGARSPPVVMLYWIGESLELAVIVVVGAGLLPTTHDCETVRFPTVSFGG